MSRRRGRGREDQNVVNNFCLYGKGQVATAANVPSIGSEADITARFLRTVTVLHFPFLYFTRCYKRSVRPKSGPLMPHKTVGLQDSFKPANCYQ